VRFISLFAVLLVAGALTLPASAQQRIPVTIASVPSASTYLALDKGYFRDAGLDVTPPHPYNSKSR
jgi:ABC-type nitrate/sulfonate/bicarbonate transport system substrate-binding protein